MGISSPTAVTLVKLRNHFRQKYQLNEMQVELMVESSCKSLKQGLARLTAVFSGDEPVAGIEALFHGFKGLFLNMGEAEWAAYTKEIERKLLAGEQIDHTMINGILRYGVAEVLAYRGTSDAACVNES
jgi:hypothetical protein